MKLKKLLSFTAAAVVSLAALTGAMTVSADVDSGTCGDLSWTLDSDGVLTFSGQGDMDSPKVTDGNAESQIGDFPNIYTYKAHKEDIKEVKIEEGVTSIGFCAFYQMPKLETVTLPSTIAEFKGSIVMFQAVESGHASEDGYHTMCYSFAKCPLLKNLTLTEGIKHIGGYAFSGCTSLDNVIIPKSLAKWDAYSFSDCSSLKNVTLTDGLTIVGSYVFCNSALQSIFIPSSITRWIVARSKYQVYKGNTNCAFENCKKLSSVTFEEGIKRLGLVSFPNCSSLKKIVIPASVTNIDYAFENCTGLQEAYIEEGAQISSGNVNFTNTFAYCSNLKRIEIPAGIDIAYSNPQWIADCSSLTDIYIHGKDYTSPLPDGGGTPKFHCYFDSKTYETLTNPYKSNIPEERMVNLADEIPAYKEMLQTRLDEAKAYDEEKYTPESYAVLKELIEKADKFGEDSNIIEMDWLSADIRTAIRGLEKKPDEPSSSDPTQQSSDDKSNPSDNSSDPSNNPTKPSNTEPTTANPATTAAPKATTNAKAVKAAKDKANAEKIMKQAKITKLTAKAKGKKKIVVSWKKVKNAKGYEVQVATNKKFKKNKIIVTKNVKGKKVTIKSNKIKRKKTYYIRVRAYTTYQDANGVTQKVYSSWIKKIRKVKAK